MTDPRTPDEWKKWYKRNKREDALVIVKDLRWILGAKNYRTYVIPHRRDTAELLTQAKVYITGQKSTVLIEPTNHQRVADSIAACAIVRLVEPNKKRQRYLLEMIKDAEGCARTNYQFVRVFLRRNLAALARAAGLSLSDFPELFPPGADQMKAFRSGWTGRIFKRTWSALKTAGQTAGTVKNLTYAASGLWRLITLCKGEFTHFEEVFPLLAALAQKGTTFGIGLMVCKPDRFEYINSQARENGIDCEPMAKKVFRYYVFPKEYILMVAGEPKQFLIFWGKTGSDNSGARGLARYDWKSPKRDKHDVVITD